MRTRNILLFLLLSLLLSSCKTQKNIYYFQDIEPGVAQEISNPLEIKVKPADKISIVINSKDPELADLFNLPIYTYRVGMPNTSYLSSSQQMSSYTVDSNGNIDFPILGTIQVAGMNREEIASFIKNELISKNLIKDPIVTVEFMNLSIFVLGEVKTPGRIDIDRDQITILDAISMAGDLTIQGQRENVLVLRDEGGKQIPYQIDLRSAEQMYASPAFYLQQNDVVYVTPNLMRARQSTVNGNNVLSLSFWISLSSLITSAAVLFVK